MRVVSVNVGLPRLVRWNGRQVPAAAKRSSSSRLPAPGLVSVKTRTCSDRSDSQASWRSARAADGFATLSVSTPSLIASRG